MNWYLSGAVFVVGVIVGFWLAIFGLLSISHNAAKIFNTPPKGK